MSMRRFLRNSKKLNIKMMLLIVALLIFLYLNVLQAAGFYGINEMLDAPTFIYMTVLAVLTLWFTGVGKEFINGFRLTFFRKRMFPG